MGAEVGELLLHPYGSLRVFRMDDDELRTGTSDVGNELGELGCSISAGESKIVEIQPRRVIEFVELLMQPERVMSVLARVRNEDSRHWRVGAATTPRVNTSFARNLEVNVVAIESPERRSRRRLANGAVTDSVFRPSPRWVAASSRRTRRVPGGAFSGARTGSASTRARSR